MRALSREREKDVASDYARALDKSEPPRNPFAGLKLKPVAIEPSATPLEKAAERYGRAAADIIRMRRMNLGVLEHQKIAFAEAGKALNAMRSDGVKDLRSVMTANPDLIDHLPRSKTTATGAGMAGWAAEADRQSRLSNGLHPKGSTRCRTRRLPPGCCRTRRD